MHHFLGHCKNWTSSTLRTLYFQNISRVFQEYVHNTENTSILWNWTKLWKLDFFNLFFTIFPKYLHTVEEVHSFQWGCCLVMIISRKMRTYFLLLFPTGYRSETCVSGYDLKYCSNDVSCSRGDCTSSGQQNCAEGQVCCKCPQ